MKTTVEVPDDLYRRAKAAAAMRGRKLKDLIGGCGSFSRLRRSRRAGRASPLAQTWPARAV